MYIQNKQIYKINNIISNKFKSILYLKMFLTKKTPPPIPIPGVRQSSLPGGKI